MENKELEKKLNDNLEFSKMLCKELNKKMYDDNIVLFTAIASTEDIGVRQLLDKRGLQYNRIYLDDKIKSEKDMDEIIELIYTCLGTGRFEAVSPSTKEIELYDKLKEYNWLDDLYIDDGILYVKGEEICIEDIDEDINVDNKQIDIVENDGRYMYKTSINKKLEVKTEEIIKEM